MYGSDLVAGGGGLGVNIMSWDGSTWHTLGSGVGSLVLDLTVYGGDLIAGGFFNTAGGLNANHVARWDGSAWHALAGGISSVVSALTVYNGELIVGGQFSAAGGLIANNIARWNGAAWQPLIGGGVDGGVGTLIVQDIGPIGQLVAGGGFTAAGGQLSAMVARYGPACVAGDIDQDGVIGALDFQSLLQSWGPCRQPCPPSCAADIDGDCAVGIIDFLTLLQNWDD